MKDFAYLEFLAKKAATTGNLTAQLKIAEQMESLIRSTITELKIRIKKDGRT